jgi:hypothetical protein
LSIERAGRWAGEQSRREQLQFLRDRGWVIALFSLGFLAVGVITLAWKANVVTGMAVGVLLSSWAWAVAMVVLQMTGTGSTLMGAQAERWTSEALHDLHKRGWRLLDAVPLKRGEGDVDHIALGPPGVFCIETKWSASDWFSSKQRFYLERAIGAAKWRAERFMNKRVAFGLKDQPIHPVLVLWGAKVGDRPEAEAIFLRNGVTVIAGPWLQRWAASLGSDELSQERIAAAADAIERYQGTQDARFYGEERSRYVRHGLGRMTDDLLRGLFGRSPELWLPSSWCCESAPTRGSASSHQLWLSAR